MSALGKIIKQVFGDAATQGLKQADSLKFTPNGAMLEYRPDPAQFGKRRADYRAATGDFPADPAARAQRSGNRLESSQAYQATQWGQPQIEGVPKAGMPKVMTPHHRVGIEDSVPFFEGSTPAANQARRGELAVGDIYPGNDDRNYTGFFDGNLSAKASPKTGVMSDDHRRVHDAMDKTRAALGLETKTGTDEVSMLPEDHKTSLLAYLALKDELNIEKVLQRRNDLIKKAFPDLSYEEIKEILLKDPKRFANLFETDEGFLASQIVDPKKMKR